MIRFAYAGSMNIREPKTGRGHLAGVFIISFASLALELLQMRIFAFVLWHHLAFLVISIALLGFGAAGAFLSSFYKSKQADPGSSTAVAALLFSITAILGALALAFKPVDLFGQMGFVEVVRVGIYYLVFALPYFFAGYIIAIAFARAGHEAGFLYFINLFGSGLGCFFIFFLLAPLGAEGALLFIAALGGAVALLCARSKKLKRVAAAAMAVFLLSIPFADRILTFRPAASKSLGQALARPDTETLFTRWTPLCRVDVCSAKASRARLVYQDGDAPTLLPNSLSRIPTGDIRNLAYLLLKEPKVLIIGVGGGPDAKAAVQQGARGIDCVDINPVILDLCRNPSFNAAAEMFSQRADIRFHTAEGRFFIRRSIEHYDLIQMTGVDTYTALASGAYVLSESYLYTMEAFHDYLDHLTEGGMLSIIRFAFPAPRETLRIVVMACNALAERGAQAPWSHIVVLKRAKGAFSEQTTFGAILVKKNPFTKNELSSLREFSDTHGFRRAYFPDEDNLFTAEQLEQLGKLVRENPSFKDYPIDDKGSNPFHTFAEAFKEGHEEAFLKAYPYDVRPVYDRAPFFFNQHHFSSLGDWILRREGSGAGKGSVPWLAMTSLFQTQPVGLILLFLTLLQLGVLVALLIFVPLFFYKRKDLSGLGVPSMLGYFLFLGFGYIFLMISAMQRFSLILGHPGYSIPVIMAVFLICSGLGSLVSGRIPIGRSPRTVAVVATLIVLYSSAIHLFLPSLTRHVMPLAFGIRVLFTVGLTGPAAFTMGMCFPLGIRIVARMNPALIPWAYGVNGGATVLGSVGVVCLAMTLGFDGVQWIAAALYVLSALSIRFMAAGAVLRT